MILTWTLRGDDKEVGRPKEVELTKEELVTAWLSILYDMLIVAPELSIIGVAEIRSPRIITALHDVVVPLNRDRIRKQIEVAWPSPDFSNFLTHDVFWKRCEDFRKQEQEVRKSCTASLVLGWVESAIDTVKNPFELPTPSESACPPRAAPIQKTENPASELTDRAMMFYWAMKHPEDKHTIKQGDEQERNEPKYFDEKAICDWLETKMPLLFTRLYAPGFWTAGGGEHGLARSNESGKIIRNLVDKYRQQDLFL